MWKRLQRVGKEACKFQFTVSYQEFSIDCQNNWYPKAVYILWSRRRRQEKSETHPLVADPDVNQRFLVSWNAPENFVALVTLFKSSSHSKFEAKEWTFSIYEDEMMLASQVLNLSDYAGRSTQLTVDLPLKSKHKSVRCASIRLTISCAFLKQGKATDDDLLSISSLMSMNKNQRYEEEEETGSERKDTKYHQGNKEFNNSGGDDGGCTVHKLAQRYNLAQYLEDNDLTPRIDSNMSKENEHPRLSLTTTTTSHSDGDVTATRQLTSWCLEMTKGYPNVHIENMTTSWRNGLAFCAILHHYRPDLIHFDSLELSDIHGNCKLAFDVGEKLGIPRVIEPSDMVVLGVPDKLSVMTYLFQLKSYFNNSSMDSDNIALAKDIYSIKSDKMSEYQSTVFDRSPSPYSVMSTPVLSLERNLNKKVDLLKPSLITSLPRNNGSKDANLFEKNVSLQFVAGEYDTRNNKIVSNENNTPSSSTSSRNLEPNREKPSTLMTRKQLLNPFDSDDEDGDKKREEKMKGSNEKESVVNTEMLNFSDCMQKCHDSEELEAPRTESPRIRDDMEEENETIDQQLLPPKQIENYSTFTQSQVDEPSQSKIKIKDQPQSTTHNPISVIEPSMLKQPSPLPTPRKFKSRQEGLREQARLLLAQVQQPASSSDARTSSNQQLTEKETLRQKGLHERARQLIYEAKSSKSVTEVIGESNTIYESPQSLRTLLKRHHNLDQPLSLEPNYYFNSADVNEVEDSDGVTGDSKPLSNDNPPQNVKVSDNLLIKDTIKTAGLPCSEKDGTTKSQYVASEMEGLEKEQLEVDARAATLEWELRRIMKDGRSKELEEEKLQEWFGLVNRKNALIRRQMQLNLLEKEKDLEKRFNLLSIELRNVMSLPDWMKTEEIRRRETMLLAELVEVVDRRDELVQSLDSQEKAIEEDEKTEMIIGQRLSNRKKKKGGRLSRPARAANTPSGNDNDTIKSANVNGCNIQ